MNLLNSCQRLKNKVSVISSKKGQRGKGFVPVLCAHVWALTLPLCLSKKGQRGKGTKAQRGKGFVPVLCAHVWALTLPLCLCACLLVSPASFSKAWAKSSRTRRNLAESSSHVSSEKTRRNPSESSSHVSSEKIRRNPPESSSPVSSDTEKQFLTEEESGSPIDSGYQHPQRPVTEHGPTPFLLSPGGRGQGEGRSFESADLLKEKLQDRGNNPSHSPNEKDLTLPFQPDPVSGYRTNSSASMLKATLSLALVLALIWVMSYLVKKYYLKGNLLGEKYIRTLDTCSLGSKGSLALVRVEDQTLLLGITSQEITLLAQVNIPDKSMPEKSKMKAADPQKRNGISNKQPAYPQKQGMYQKGMASRISQNRSAMPAQAQPSSATGATGAFHLSPEHEPPLFQRGQGGIWTSLDGEENQDQGRVENPYHSSEVFDDFAEQLSLHSLRFQSPEPPEGRVENPCKSSNVQENSTDSIAGILESRFKGLKRI